MSAVLAECPEVEGEAAKLKLTDSSSSLELPESTSASGKASSDVISLEDQLDRVRALLVGAKAGIEEVCQALWLRTPPPASASALVEKLRRAPAAILAQRKSDAHAGASVALASIQATYRQVDVVDLVDNNISGQPLKNFFEVVRSVANRIAEKLFPVKR